MFPQAILSWNISSITDVNQNSLCLFTKIQPKIDILIIGTGDEPVTSEIGKEILQVMHKYKINVEILGTEQVR